MTHTRKLKNFLYNTRHHLGRATDWGNLPYSLIPSSTLKRKLKESSELRKRPVAFVISPGRAGSGYVSELFSNHPQVRTFHEPRPRMNGRAMNENLDKEKLEKFRMMKLYAICKQLREMPESTLYLETSHMFIKTFSSTIVEFFDNTKVIRLIRDEAHILKSCLELGYFSDRNHSWKNWMKVPKFARADKPAMQCIAYLRSVDRLALDFSQRYTGNPRVTIEDFALEELRTKSGLQRLSKHLCVDGETAIREASLQQVNARSARKLDIASPVSIEQCQQLIKEYDERYSSQ